MSISFSRPDPSSPNAVGSAAFSVGRRGFDQNEVRDFLRMVAAELARLQEREKFLERELRSAQTRAISEPGALTEEMVTELLGEETARIIAAAREAAHQIRERAEETAGRLIREASDDASRIRQEADIDAQRMRSDAAGDAQAEIEMARQQGTDMVNEARQYRERVLNELSRRRELAREQIEQFEHGRDRLLTTFERARQSTEEVLSELAVTRDEDAELIDLTNTTGPIAVVNTDSIPGAIFDVEAEADADVEAEVEKFEVAEAEEAVVEVEETATDDASLSDSKVTSAVFGEAPEAPTAEVTVIEPAKPAASQPETGHVAEVVSLFDKSPQRKEETATAPKAGGASVDDLFKKLRTSSTEQVVERVKAKPKVEQTAKPTAKEEAVTPVVEAKATKPKTAVAKQPVAPVDLATESENLSRKLKRLLADEQNEHFEFLRRKGAGKKMDSMLGDIEVDIARYRTGLEKELLAAALKGAASVSTASEADLRRSLKSGDALDGVFIYLTDTVIDPIRKSVAKSLSSSAGEPEKAITALRGIYRQWRNDKIDAIAEDLCQMAYGRGAQNTTNQK